MCDTKMLWFVAVFLVHVLSLKEWTGGSGTPSWNDAGNWNPEGVPGLSDDVVLDFATVTVGEGAVAKSLSVSGTSSISLLEAPLSITSNFDLNDGATLKVTTGPKTTLQVNGTATVHSASLFFNSGHLQGKWIIEENGHLNFASSAPTLQTIDNLDNKGTIQVSSCNQSRIHFTKLTNEPTGKMILGSGHVHFYQLSNLGDIYVSGGSVNTDEYSGQGVLHAMDAATIKGSWNQLSIENNGVLLESAQVDSVIFTSSSFTIDVQLTFIGSVSGFGNINVHALATLNGNLEVGLLSLQPPITPPTPETTMVRLNKATGRVQKLYTNYLSSDVTVFLFGASTTFGTVELAGDGFAIIGHMVTDLFVAGGRTVNIAEVSKVEAKVAVVTAYSVIIDGVFNVAQLSVNGSTQFSSTESSAPHIFAVTGTLTVTDPNRKVVLSKLNFTLHDGSTIRTMGNLVMTQGSYLISRVDMQQYGGLEVDQSTVSFGQIDCSSYVLVYFDAGVMKNCTCPCRTILPFPGNYTDYVQLHGPFNSRTGQRR